MIARRPKRPCGASRASRRSSFKEPSPASERRRPDAHLRRISPHPCTPPISAMTPTPGTRLRMALDLRRTGCGESTWRDPLFLVSRVSLRPHRVSCAAGPAPIVVGGSWTWPGYRTPRGSEERLESHRLGEMHYSREEKGRGPHGVAGKTARALDVLDRTSRPQYRNRAERASRRARSDVPTRTF
jgi:hypothetical protein